MNYFIKRLGRSVITLFLVVAITFGLTRLLPGGPVATMRGRLRRQNPSMTTEQINQQVQAAVGVRPDSPLYVQFYNYVTGIFQGDFGESIALSPGTPVMEMYVDAIPWTLFVLGTATLITFAISVTLGALLAYREGSRMDVGLSSASIVLNSIPYYIAAIVLIGVFATWLDWFPFQGNRTLETTPGFNIPFMIDVLHHAILPMLSVIITGFGAQMLGMRSNSIRVLGEDYIRVARLRMLPTNRIATRYVARNAILPIYTGFIISIGFILGGSVILEEIFRYPGVGRQFFAAVAQRDYPVMMGGFLLISFAVVIAVFVADLTYGLIDPRASAGGDNEAY
jgi:peptide/nickel transport system permease protein